MENKEYTPAQFISCALGALGIRWSDDNADTPRRIAKMWAEIIEGEEEPKMTLFDGREVDQMVIIDKIPFNSFCAHHHLPCFGQCHVAYIPNEHIVGLSKIPRVVKWKSKAFTTQEYLTRDIALYLKEKLQCEDVAVIMTGTHTCMQCRGVESLGETVTSTLTGEFRKTEVKNEFLNFIK